MHLLNRTPVSLHSIGVQVVKHPLSFHLAMLIHAHTCSFMLIHSLNRTHVYSIFVQVVKDLLSFVRRADYSIREEVVLKIAILAEKYATDFTWYVILSLAYPSSVHFAVFRMSRW